MQARTLVAVALATSQLALGCDDDPPAGPACTPAPVSSSCTPAYEPSYEQVFAKTLQPTCAKSGVSCHASSGRQGGLAFDDADEAYRMMLESTRVVVAGDPGCSELVARLAATDGNVRMPPGRSLDASEQCAITQWIARGAKRR